MGVKSTKFRQGGRSIPYDSTQRTGGGSTWSQRYRLNYLYSQSGGTPGTFSVVAGERYVFFGVASGGNGGTSGEGPGGTAGGGGGASQVNGYFWTAPNTGDVTVTTTQGSDLTLVLPAASPTTIFSLNRGQNSGPSYLNYGAGGAIGTYGSHAGGNGGQGGQRDPNSGVEGYSGSSGTSGRAGGGGGGSGSFWSNYGAGQWGRTSSGYGGGSNNTTPIPKVIDPSNGSPVNVFLQDGSQGFQIVGTSGGAGADNVQNPTGSPVPPYPGSPWSAPNGGASGGGGGGGGGLRFTSTSPTLGNAFGGGGGAGSAASTAGAPGFFIAFQLVSSLT